jgi:hypothetical protein
MAEPEDIWPITVRGEVLEVRRSGFDTDLYRQKTRVIAVPARAWVARGTASADATRDRDGSRRRATQLQDEGVAVGRAKARRLMPQAGGAVQGPTRRGPGTTESRHA